MPVSQHSQAMLTIPLLIASVLCSLAPCKTIYVDDDATGADDGTSWADAYVCFQDALADANDSAKPLEICVAQGVYKPDEGVGQSAGDRSATFQLIDGVTIKGGYAGLNSANPYVRDIAVHVSVLSGDLDGQDADVDDPGQLQSEPTRGDNSYYVVTGRGTDATAVMDGFTVTGGQEGFRERVFVYGSGMRNDSGSPTVANCTFIRNSDAGMHNRESHPILTNCVFAENSGSGMDNLESNPTLAGCVFRDNSSSGMCNKASSPILADCNFQGNFALAGGGMYNRESSPILINCSFLGNSTDGGGGGMYNTHNSEPNVVDCHFVGNSARNGGAVYSTGVLVPGRNGVSDPVSQTLAGCTFRNNSAKPPYDYGGDGGAIYNDGDSILIDCSFIENAARNGGGISTGRAVLTECMFIGNSADLDGGAVHGNGGTLANCRFSANSAGRGGALYNLPGGDVALAECGFSGNRAIDGGGIFNEGALKLTNCLLSGNLAAGHGGAIDDSSAQQQILSNCTFAQNAAGEGRALFHEGITWPHYIKLTNCILWDGGSEIAAANLMHFSVDYSAVQDSSRWPPYGSGNTDRDPLFAAFGGWTDTADPNMTIRPDDPNVSWVEGVYPDSGYWTNASDPSIIVSPYDPCVVWVDGDYHLKSQAGRWTPTSPNAPDPNSTTWVIDAVTSPCVDAGDPATALGAESEPNGWIVNMGAYGGTSQASRSCHEQETVSYQAYAPIPADGEDSMSMQILLSWVPGLNAVSHNVFFGPNSPPEFVRNQMEIQYDPGRLAEGTTYHWRIDEVDGGGDTIVGVEWSFTTPRGAKGNYCFPGDTLVWIEGAPVPISAARSEQTVTALHAVDLELPSMPLPCPGKVEQVQMHEGEFTCFDIFFESGNRIAVADTHYFMDESGKWIALEDIGEGTSLRTRQGYIKVVRVTERPFPYAGTVYNLTVKDSDSYCVGKDGIVVRDY